MGIEINKVKTILAVRNDRFGEFLLNIPALRAVKETFVNARLIVVVNPCLKELVKGLPCVDEAIFWDNQKHTFLDKIRMVKLLKTKNIEIAIMLNPSKDFNLFSWLCRIPVRVGYNKKRGFLLTHKIDDKKHLGQKHEVEYNLELVSLIGAGTDNKALSLDVDVKLADSFLDGFAFRKVDVLVAVHPFTSDPVKQWPMFSFRDLAMRLISELNLKVLIIGGREHSAQSQAVFGNTDKRLLDLTAKTSLEQLAAIFKRCKLLISGDSGPMHLACACATPVVALFRNDLPGKTAQRWGPWGSGNFVIEKHGLSAISVEEVFNKVKGAI